MRIAARIVLLSLALLAAIVAEALFGEPSGPRDALGISGPTVVRVAREEGGPVEPQLAYTGMSRGRGAWLLTRPLNNTADGNSTAPLLAPDSSASVYYNGVYGAQFVAPDRLYYILRSSSPGSLPSRTVHLARWTDGTWQNRGPVLTATRGGIDSVSVLAPGPAGAEWRMWFVEARGTESILGYATSHDGISWQRRPESNWRPDTGRIETISVLPWGPGLRAWAVVYDPKTVTRSLVGFDIGSGGKPLGDPEPVAWQAPELRFGNLPKDAIPIVDARAEAGEGEIRDVRLYITYRGTDGRTRICVAENFPVAGERSPTIFARQPKPLIEQGSDRAASRHNPLAAVALVTIAIVLAILALRPGRRPGVNASDDASGNGHAPIEDASNSTTSGRSGSSGDRTNVP